MQTRPTTMNFSLTSVTEGIQPWGPDAVLLLTFLFFKNLDSSY